MWLSSLHLGFWTSSPLQFFVFCHSLLQFAQLLASGYMKSSISTIERRYGLSSQKSGVLAAFNEVNEEWDLWHQNVGLILAALTTELMYLCSGGKHGPHRLCEFLWGSSSPTTVYWRRSFVGLLGLPADGADTLPEWAIWIHGRLHQWAPTHTNTLSFFVTFFSFSNATECLIAHLDLSPWLITRSDFWGRVSSTNMYTRG